MMQILCSKYYTSGQSVATLTATTFINNDDFDKSNWRFPTMGNPRIIHFNGMFPSKPTNHFGIPPFQETPNWEWGNLQMSKSAELVEEFQLLGPQCYSLLVSRCSQHVHVHLVPGIYLKVYSEIINNISRFPLRFEHFCPFTTSSYALSNYWR